jgi:excisionase family DNA binding protein
MLTVADAARRLGVSESLVYEWCRTRALVHYRFGARGRGKIMIRETDLAAYLEACRVELGLDDGELKHIG